MIEIAEWLNGLFPEIDPDPWRDPCWVAGTQTRSPEHHPPLYWLGRALDDVAANGALEAVHERLVAAHGTQSCGGGERDERLQDALTEVCAYAWSATYLGAPRLESAGEGGTMVRVPALDVVVGPRRLRPVRRLPDLFEQIGEHCLAVAAQLPEARERIVYLDTYLNMQMYAQDVGYRLELTEPVRAAVKQIATDAGLGYVLTRPFQWGNPVEAWY